MPANFFVMPRFVIKSCNVGNRARGVALTAVMVVRKRATSLVENARFRSVIWHFRVVIAYHQWNVGSPKTSPFCQESVELELYEHYRAGDIKRKYFVGTMKRRFSVQAYAEGFCNADTRLVRIRVTPAQQQNHIRTVSLPTHHVDNDAIKTSPHVHIDVVVCVIPTTTIAAFAHNNVNWAVPIPVAPGNVDRIVFLVWNPVHGIVVISASAPCRVVPHAIDFHAINVVISPSIAVINVLRFVEKRVRQVNFAKSAGKRIPRSILSSSKPTKLWTWMKIPLSFYHVSIFMQQAF